MRASHNTKTSCHRCGEPFGAGPRHRILRQVETSRGNFSTDGFSAYYCDRCIQVMTWLIDKEAIDA